jgi:outer membrane receptor protein involved in Fe transport
MTAKRTSRKNPLAFAVSVATAALISVNASAQLEEVIVTAQKRAESAQDVPIAITAFDTEALAAKQITGFADMRFAAPNVTYTKANFAGNNFSIRGVGTNLVAASADNGVGVHVNEVPLISPRLFETEYFDVEQVAVLRGPQGTLYGRNSTGGAVNMITRTADSAGLNGNIEGQYGDYDHTKLNGHINIPLGDNLAVRFAGLYLDRDGYTDNIVTGNDVDGRDQYALRGSLNWQPGDSTSIDLMVSYFDESSSRSRSQKNMCHNDPSALLGCLPDKLAFESPNTSATLGVIVASDAVLGPLGIFEFGANPAGNVPNDFRKIASARDPEYEADETLVTLHVKQEIGNYTLALVGGYQDTTVWSQADYTMSEIDPVQVPDLLALAAPQTYNALFTEGLPISKPSKNATGIIGGNIDSINQGSVAYDQSNQESEQYSIEARIQSDYDGPLNFLLGGFYMDVDLKNQYWVLHTGLDYFAAVAPAALFAADGIGWVAPQFNNDVMDYTIESKALFGELYYDFTETLKLTLGARYTIDSKDIKDGQFLLNNDPVTGAPLLQPIGADLPIPIPVRNTDKEWKEWTGRAVLDWAVTNDSMVYASYSRGYKGGGFNPPFDPVEFPGTASEFDPEFVDAFEIGIKNTLFDNTLQANFTAFYYDYQDMQISKIINRTSFNANTDAEIYGLEAELVFAPNEHWMFNANSAYLHSEAKDYQDFDGRDPTAGRDDVTLIKDLGNASNCVVQGIDPATFNAVVGSQFDSCTALADAGLSVVPGIEVDLDGNQLVNSPEWSVSLGGQYMFILPQDYRLTMRVDYYWQDEMYYRLFNRDMDKIDSWDIWNAQLSLTSPEDNWYARAFVKNIADDDHEVGGYLTDPSSGLWTNIFTIEPRTYGMAIGYNFN